ncbi:MAG: GNAT family N-acetyltransferase [Bacilli bacterium]|nr:GNAT family N-acetyltransferase [Bacilli bacterium]
MNTKFNCSNCLRMQYDLLKGMFFDNIEETLKYVLCTSKVMDDCFWNLAYLKDKVDTNDIIEIENKLKVMDRLPCVYIGRDDNYYNDNKKKLLNMNYQIKDTDVFMILDNFLKIDININVKVVETEQEYNDFMKVLSSAYNDNFENEDENVYADAVTKCYYDAVKASINNGKTYHIIGYNEDNIPVSVATLNIDNGIGGINNVGTHQGYWNLGYNKQVLTYLINLFKEKGGESLILCTEHHSKNQIYYERLGFREIYVMEQYVK